MGRSTWSWTSNGRASGAGRRFRTSVAGLTLIERLPPMIPRVAGAVLKKNLEPLESQSSIGILGAIGIPKLNWNLQGKACGHLGCLSRVARPSLRSNSQGILNNSKQIGIPGLDWNPRSAHTPHPRVLPRRARGSCSVWSSVTHTRATQEQISTSAHSSPAPCAASWRSCFAETS